MKVLSQQFHKPLAIKCVEGAAASLLPAAAGVSNIKPVGQNRPGQDSNPAHWTSLENVK